MIFYCVKEYVHLIFERKEKLVSKYNDDPYIRWLRSQPEIAKYPQFIDLLIALKEESERLGLPSEWEGIAQLALELREQGLTDALSSASYSVLFDTHATVEEMLAPCRFYTVNKNITSALFSNDKCGTVHSRTQLVSTKGFRNLQALETHLESKGLIHCSIFHLLAVVAIDPLLPVKANVAAMDTGVETRYGLLIPSTGANEDNRTALKLVEVGECFNSPIHSYFLVQAA